jgi:ribonuclease D
MRTESHSRLHNGDISPEFLDHIRATGAVAWDIETSGLDWRKDRIGTCQLATYDEVAVVKLGSRTPPTALADLLSDGTVTKVFHHAPFDLRFMAHQWKTPILNVACTKITSKILDPQLPSSEHSLKPTLDRHLGIEISKAAQQSNWMADTLTEEQLKYAAADVQHLLELYDVLVAKCARISVIDLVLDSFRYLPTRVLLDLRGSGDVFVY